MKIGFIGLGIMGKPMAKNLLKAGYSLVVNDINKEAVAEVVASGATEAASAKEVAQQSDVVITMLPNSPHVQTVVLGEGGVIEGAKEGLIVVDMSSISPIVSREVAAELAKKGVVMLDAPFHRLPLAPRRSPAGSQRQSMEPLQSWSADRRRPSRWSSQSCRSWVAV